MRLSRRSRHKSCHSYQGDLTRQHRLRIEQLEDRRLLTIFAVNSLLDTVDINPGDGLALDAQGQTTLRAAIMEANASSGADTIQLPAGTYSLNRAGIGEDGGATGDLDISNDMTILGAGDLSTIIDATGLGDRVFDVMRGTSSSNTIDVQWQGVTIMGGSASYSGSSTSWQRQDHGGGIYIDYYTNVTISSCILRNNSSPRTATNSSYGSGGAIDSGGVLTILDSRFENNSASNSGGAIYVGTSTATTVIRNTTFSGNLAYNGGAIHNGYQMTIENSTFSGNAGLSASGSQGNGGAIKNSGPLTITNCTFSGNQTHFGGAIYNFGTLYSTNNTITSNIANYSGGGIENSTNSTARFQNTIIAGNSAATRGPDVYGTVTSLGNNLVGNTTGVTGFGTTGDLLNVAPLLASLADNGGLTQTHALLRGSPAFNAANTTNSPAVDQRGVSRPQGAAADIGAFEADPSINDPLALTLTINASSISEGAGTGATTATIMRSPVTADPLVVYLTSSDTTEATVPTSVTIPANQASATFNITAVDDSVVDGTQVVTISARTAMPDGTAGSDTTFGLGGIATTSLRTTFYPPHVAVAIQADGKVLAASQSTSGDYAWRLTRLNADGTTDTSFGVNGIVDTTFSTQNPLPNTILVQPNGKILVGGKFVATTGSTLARYNADGSLDTSFGTGGIANLSSIGSSWIADMALCSNGNIMLALAFNGTVYLRAARLTSTGSLDTTFGTSGIKTYTVNEMTNAITMMPDGRFLLAGGTSIIRANASGSLDTTFGVSGVQTIGFGTVDLYTNIENIAIDSAGRIVLGVTVAETATSGDFGAARLSPNGTLDTSFSGDGKVSTDFPAGLYDGVYSMVVQCDDKIVLVGSTEVSTDVDRVALVRYNVDGSLDTTFDGDGRFVLSITSSSGQRAQDAALQADGKLVILAGLGSDWRVARFNTGVVPLSATDTLDVTDNDVAGITVTPTSGLVTTEATGTATFTVRLTSQPSANVTIGLSSSDTTEGTVSPSSLTFTSSNWNTPRTVTVRGVNDYLVDGNIAYTIVTAAATSSDPNYSGLNAADVSATNTDNDVAGFTVSPTSGLVTTEAGGTATFTVRLTSQPTANVTIGLSSSDTTEGTVSPSSLTFTSSNWNTTQTVTVRGVDDFVMDGNVSYSILTAAATSGDSNYNGMNPADVSVTNTDNDVAGITVAPTSGLVTTEAGGTATFTVKLNSQPTADVTIGLSSDDTTEGTVSPTSLTFTSSNWSTPRTVTITAVDDAVFDGDTAYSILTAAATSADALYQGRDADNVAVINEDDDIPSDLVVSTLADENDRNYGSGDLSLREAIALANRKPDANRITFDSNLTSGGDAIITLDLFNAEVEGGVGAATALLITSEIRISGPVGDNGITICRDSGDSDRFRLFHVSASGKLTIERLTLSGGSAQGGPGGAIFNEGTLVLDQSTLSNNSAIGGAGIASIASCHWTQAGGDAGHAGYVDVSIDQPAFAEVWSVPMGFSQSAADGTLELGVASDGERVYYTTLEGYAPAGNYYVYALDLQTGTVLWRRTLVGRTFDGVGRPSAGNGLVYVNRAGHSGISGGTYEDLPKLYGLDAITGVDVFATTYSAQWGYDARPTVAGNQVVIPDGYYGSGITVLNATTGANQWHVDGDGFNTTVDDEYIYTSGKKVYSRVSGAGLPDISHPEGRSINTPIVSPSGKLLYSADNGVAVFDGDSHAYLRTLNTPAFVSAKAVGNGKVAVIAGNTLYLFDEAAGNELFHWSIGQTIEPELILTNTHAIVQTINSTSSSAVHLIDLSSGQSIWSCTISIPWGETKQIGMAFSDGYLVLSHHQFVKAFAIAGLGGAIYNDGGSVTISSSTISGNTASGGKGGAVYNRNGTLSIQQSTLTDNAAEQGGRGVYQIADGATASLAIHGSIIAQADINVSDVLVAAANGGINTTNGTFNLIRTAVGFDGAVVSTADPMLGPLTDNGGPSQTHAPRFGSPVIDAGDPAISVGVDQRGETRQLDGNSDGDPRVDVGAVEIQAFAGILVSPTSGLLTTESGGTTSFTVVLTKQPTGDVLVAISSSDASEGTVQPASLNFTPANWNLPQSATIAGADDTVTDGNVPYTIVTAAATSTDPNYHAIDPADVSLTNTDDDLHPPTDIALSATAIPEGRSTTTRIGLFSTIDPDTGGQFIYTLVPGAGSADNTSFTITGTGLYPASVFDYETKSSYNIRVRSTDPSGLWFEKPFTIAVTDVNFAPTGIALSNSAVPENMASSTVVGTLSSTDSEPPAGPFVYSLVSGAGSTDNAQFTIVGDQLKTAATFDYETKSSYSIRVQTADAGGLTYEKQFTIAVNDHDEISPTVTRVLVASSDWSSQFLNSLGGIGYAIPDGPNQVLPLALGNLNQLIVEFSEDVIVAQDDLAIFGVNVPNYGFSAFSYDAVAHRATWTLSQGLPVDKLLIDLDGNTATSAVVDLAGNRLDGEWANPTWNPPSSPVGGDAWPSGNGVPGGNFQFRFNVLPGDANGSGTTDATDLNTVLSYYNQAGMTGSTGDFNGDGRTDATDLNTVLSYYNRSLPVAEPVAPAILLTPEQPSADLTPDVTDVVIVSAAADSTDVIVPDPVAPAAPVDQTAEVPVADLMPIVTDVVIVPTDDAPADVVAPDAAAPIAPADQAVEESPADLTPIVTDVVTVPAAEYVVMTVDNGPTLVVSAPLADAGTSAGHAWMAAEGQVPASPNVPAATDSRPIIDKALAWWMLLGETASTIPQFSQVQLTSRDVSDTWRGETQPSRIYHDRHAESGKRFIDPTLPSGRHFASSRTNQRSGTVDSRVVDRIDLSTVVEHELGKIAGFDVLDALANDLMSSVRGHR